MSPALGGPRKMCQKSRSQMTKSRLLVSTPVSCPGHIYVSWSRSRPELCRRVSVCNGRWRQYRCHADAQYQTFLPVPLQALVVLDYELIIVMKTAAGVLMGRRREPPPLYCWTQLNVYNDSRQLEWPLASARMPCSSPAHTSNRFHAFFAALLPHIFSAGAHRNTFIL